MIDWELVFKAISDPALILDRDHRVLAANPAAEAAAGPEHGGLVGRRCYEAFHCADHAPDGCPHRALAKLQMPITLEMEMQALGCVHLVTVAPILNKSGELVQTIHISRDISARKRVEQALRESEERFRAIFEGSIDGILLADADSQRFLTGNRAICEMLGYSSQELRQLSVTDIHPAEALDHVVAQFEAQLRGELKVAVDLPVRRKDGSIFQSDIASAPVQIGDRRYLVGSFRDIKQRRQLEEVALEAKDRVIRQVQDHEAYVLEVADRLRNPLQILMGYLELMPDDNLSTSQRDCLEHIGAASERMLLGLRKLT